MSNWSPKPMRPESKEQLFEMDDTVEVVKKSLTPMQRQRRKDGTPYTRGGATSLRPEGLALYLGDDKVSKGSLDESGTSEPVLDPTEVVKAYLKFNAG